jgi:hypothetical protein
MLAIKAPPPALIKPSTDDLGRPGITPSCAAREAGATEHRLQSD